MPFAFVVINLSFTADENQRLCAGIFPQAFVLMQNHTVLEIVRPITSLVGLAVAGNGALDSLCRTDTWGGGGALLRKSKGSFFLG